MRKRSWDKEDLVGAVKESTSYRRVIKRLGLVPAGGNYSQIKKYIKEYNLDTSHFSGKCWNRGLRYRSKTRKPIREVLTNNSDFQSYKVKQRLFEERLKDKVCEECGWAEVSDDGRLPLELNHINGNSRDNRIENLEILCPNCHSLRPHYRGRNKKSPSGGIGIRASLKMM